MANLLVVDDEKSIRNTLKDILEHEGYTVDTAENGKEALKLLSEKEYNVVLSDIKMPQMDGIEFLDAIRENGIETSVIMLSAHGNIETAVDSTKKGAFDFLEKPPDLNRLLLTVRNAIEKTDLVTETKVLKKKIKSINEIIGNSKEILDVLQQIEKVGPSNARVLITGANGVGKELVARAIHNASDRANYKIIEVNCAAIPSELIESELFGHEKGAFTSAIKQRIGKFEQANGGTLFLDEIGDMSLSAQAKVLRALQENTITRVGGDKDIKVDVRIIAATNKDLKQEIADKKFREDLYHRLSVILIKIPTLKERNSDIPLLVDKFLKDICSEHGTPVKTIDMKALQYMQGLDWTGNIRELRNVVERLIILAGKHISLEDVQKYA